MLTRQEILSSRTPLVFKKVLTWQHKNWPVDKWKTVLGRGGSKYPYRKGSNYCSEQPLWENKCDTIYMTMEEFFSYFDSSNRTDSWFYFDYKHISQWFTDILKDITWECVGFPERKGEDSTLWIGTEDAHTPCHMDTYGCNLIAQIYGKKMWLLFDPSEGCNLSPTRVPYEESSVYSNINFSCSRNRFPEINHATCVILEPGDVLYVPKNWWHYVEHLTSAISINTWIPVESDDDSRINESLVKFFITSVVTKLDNNQVDDILNPNERDIGEIKYLQCLNELNWCLNLTKDLRLKDEAEHKVYEKYFDYTPPVQSLKFIMENIKKPCRSTTPICTVRNSSVTVNQVINAFCHPDIISLVKKKLQDQLESD